MKITVMGVLIVFGGVLLLVLLLEHVCRNFLEKPQNQPKVDRDERSNLS